MKVFILVKLKIDEAEMDQSNLFENVVEFNEKSRPREKEDKEKKKYFWSVNVPNTFKSGILPKKATKGEALKVLNCKQRLIQ